MTEFKLPELGENVHTGTVTRVMVAAGKPVAKEQGVVEVETDKAAIEVPSTVSGTVREVRVKPGDKVSPGDVLFTVDGAGAEGDKAQAETGVLSPASRASETGPKTRAGAPSAGAFPPASSPSARRRARELGVDLGAAPRVGSAAPSAGAATPELPDFAKWGPVERVPMSPVRRATSEHMATAWANIPQVTQFDKADIGAFEKLRRERSTPEVKITTTALALKVSAAALRRFPAFNASVDAAAGEIVYKKYVHIGVAVETERGLLVPVIRDADKKTLGDLSRGITDLARRARAKKLGVDEMKGGTFTITNLGGIGGVAFAPIVNWPEVAILGVARAVVEPVWINGKFEPRTRMTLSLSYDHRLIDGADGARFLRFLCEAIEDPLKLAFEGPA